MLIPDKAKALDQEFSLLREEDLRLNLGTGVVQVSRRRFADIAAVVSDALRQPTFASCRAVLRAAGFEMSLSSNCPMLTERATAWGIRLASLGLRQDFYLRFARWPDGIGLQAREHGPAALCHLWRGLSGRRVPWHARKLLRDLVRYLGIERVAAAMAEVFEGNAGDDPWQAFSRLCDNCRQMVSRVGKSGPMEQAQGDAANSEPILDAFLPEVAGHGLHQEQETEKTTARSTSPCAPDRPVRRATKEVR